MFKKLTRTLIKSKWLLLGGTLFLTAATFVIGKQWNTEHTVSLTAEEKAWLKAHPVIRLAPNPDFPPTEFFDANGNHTGVAADYTALLQKKLGVRFQVVKLRNWSEVLIKTRQREIDVLAAATKTPERSEYLLFTKPYLEFPAVLIARSDFKGPLTLRNMTGKKMSVKAGYAARYYVVTNFPEVQVDVVPDSQAGLKKVSVGTSDAFLENLLTASYYMEKDLITDLRNAGEAEFMYRMAFAVRSDWPILQGILEKGLDQITSNERQMIYNKWVPLNAQFLLINKRLTPPIFIGAGSILFLVMLVFFGNLTLRRQVARRTGELNEELGERRRIEAALRESEEKFRVLAETSPAAIFLYQGESLIYVNHAAMRITGFTERECLTMRFWDWIDADFQEQVKSYGLLRQKGVSVPDNYEAKFRTKDGKIKWVLVSAGRIQYRGESAGIASVIDITDLKNSEGELRRTNEELELRVKERTAELATSIEKLRFAQYAVEKSSHQVFCLKKNGTLSYVNDSACHSLGYKREELIGMSISKIDPDLKFEYQTELWSRLRKNSSLIFESKYRRKNGQSYQVEVHANFVTFNCKEYICFFVSDISARKNAEETLRKNELDMRELVLALQQKQGLLNTLIDAIPDLIFYKDTEGFYHGCNKSFESFVGKSKDSLIGCTDYDLFPAELAHFFREKDSTMLSKQSACRNEECVRYPDGRQVLLETLKTPYYDPEGNLLGLIGISRDITQRKEAEESLRKSNEELDSRVRERTAQLTCLTAELSRAEEFERRRIASDLHDQVVQTLALSKIKLHSLLLSGHVGEGDEALSEIIGHLSTAIDEIRSLTFQLSPPILHEFGLAAALEWLSEEFQNKYAVRIHFRDDGKPKTLDEEIRAALYQMSRELLVNVIKHARAKNVRVDVSAHSGLVSVCISDDGIGFDPSDAFRYGSANNSIGLLNIHHRMDHLGGKLAIESVFNGGTRARLILPTKTHANKFSGDLP